MQKFFVSVCFIVVGAVSLQAQNVVYDANAEVRKVEPFNKIRVSNAISLYLSQGSEQAVAVSAEDKEITSRIKTEVSNGTLKIYVENGMWNKWNWSNRHLKAYVTFTELQLLDASGACAVQFTDPVTVDDLKIEVSGASSLKGAIKGANLTFDLNGASSTTLDATATSLDISSTGASVFKGKVSGEKIKFNVSGASTADVDGNTTSLIVSATGASNFKGYDLQSTTCQAEATGASSVSISVTKDLDAKASGASNIHYSGGAVITNLDVSGSSTVKKKG